MAESTGGEHRVQIPANGAGQGKVAAPEKQLNGFVRSVALIERGGNALGTLAFTWATVVLLGGYPTDLRKDDFSYATTIVFLEATRMFSRSNKLDYQLFFRTVGAFRPIGLNGLLIVIVYFSVILTFLRKHTGRGNLLVFLLTAMAILLAIGPLMSTRAIRLRRCNPLRRVISLWSPMIAVLLMSPSIKDQYYDYQMHETINRNSMAKWILYGLLFVSVLLVTASRLRLPSIIRLLDTVLGSKIVYWRRLILNLCMFAAIVFSVYISQYYLIAMFVFQICALVVVSFGNLQIPAAVVRVVLALLRLTNHDYLDNDNKDQANLVPSLNIFYGMVLGQGVMYIVACMLEVFSFIPRRFLVRSAGFRGQLGVEYVNLYYAYAYENCIGGSVLVPKKTSLITFAMDCLDSDSPTMQLYGVQMLHNFMESEHTKRRLLPELTSSVKTMTKLISMLDWTSPKYTAVRLFAAKVVVELAKNLRVDTIPGTMQLVSALLDVDHKHNRGNQLLHEDDEQEEREYITQNSADNNEELDGLSQGTHILLETPTRSTQQVGTTTPNSRVLNCWQRISEFWSIPKEQPLIDHDLLPALGMSIIGSLAACDQGNCLEISKATYLIPKIIGFTSYRSDTMYSEAQQKVILNSSLKVLQRLSSVDGEIGTTLRYNISKHLFLLRNLAGILGDNTSNLELKRMVARILTNLAIDGDTRRKIGHSQPIIYRLMQTFLNPEGALSTNDGHLLRMVAGQALTMLAMESAHNCLVMLKEPEFVQKLKTMILIHDDRYMYVAASLLRNLCLHARPKLEVSDLEALSHTLREVLEGIMKEGIMKMNGAELEVLIGLSSQLCEVIPQDFARELENGQIKQRFVKRLVDALNANMKPSTCCPGIRRVILEQAISMMEYDSRYANCFNECLMIDALSLVEETLSEVENYMLFLGDAGFMEYSTPISALVDKAKKLMGHLDS